MEIQNNASLLSRNTFRMDVEAEIFAEYDNVEELLLLLSKFNNKKMFHVGAGSNLLFTKNFDGVILHSKINYFKEVRRTLQEVLFEVGAGVVLDDFINYSVENGYWGLENLSYIPGEAGASAVQNVGAYGVEIKDVIDSVNTVEIATECRKTFSLHECQYGYRDSVFKKELCGKYIITSVVYRLSLIPKPVLEYGNVAKHLPEGVTVDNITPSQIRDIIINIRKNKLPDVAELGSAGSFFKNPVVPMDVFEKLQCQFPDIPHYLQFDGVKIPAAWLIEQCGWKGKSFGGAKVYEKQPLVIVNQNNASPNDVIVLAQSVANSVKKSFGISIVPEVIYI
ncbi:MAG: UDP-N-acetylmuramate dehydrogenase [Candidatus Aphodosoma sp.]